MGKAHRIRKFQALSYELFAVIRLCYPLPSPFFSLALIMEGTIVQSIAVIIEPAPMMGAASKPKAMLPISPSATLPKTPTMAIKIAVRKICFFIRFSPSEPLPTNKNASLRSNFPPCCVSSSSRASRARHVVASLLDEKSPRKSAFSYSGNRP